MDFDPVEICYSGDGWTDVFAIVLIWILPVVLLALRRQVPSGSPCAGLLGVALGLAGVVATLLSLPWLDVIRPSDPEYPVAVLLLAWSSAASIGGVYLYRRMARARA